MTTCTYCGVEVDPNSRETWHQITGWSRPGKAGGSDIALRERVVDGDVACDVCIRRIQAGANPSQEAMTW